MANGQEENVIFVQLIENSKVQYTFIHFLYSSYNNHEIWHNLDLILLILQMNFG